MGSSMVRVRLLLPAFVLLLPALAGNVIAKQETTLKQSPSEGFRVEKIEQVRTDVIAWVRVQVVARTDPQKTWLVLQNVDAYAEFLDIFSKVTQVERAGAMTRYRMSVSPPWPVPDFDSVIWIAKLPEQRVILWRKNREDLSANHGKITVEETEGGSRVIYEIHGPAKDAFPPWVVRIGLYLVLPGVAQDFYDRIQQHN